MITTDSIFNIQTDEEFRSLALEIFRFQFEQNPVYRSFCDLLYRHPSDVTSIEDIPFLPIEFFKSHKVLSTESSVQKIFSSSGTTQTTTSKHFVSDLSVYEQSFRKGISFFYDDLSSHTIIALLPSYLERDDSSLVYMINDLISTSKHEESGFYLNNLDALDKTLRTLEAKERKTLLIGVSFALLDLIETYQYQLKHTTIMETGGMKGRRKELIRADLHQRLIKGFGVNTIHSEYGMTELLSQAYSKGQGIFATPPWMRVLVRDTEDALSLISTHRTGGLNVIDLANIHSCSFIATQDLGRLNPDHTFEVLGRFDHSDIRGCNLMAL